MSEVGNGTILLDIHDYKGQVKDPPLDVSSPVILENIIRKVSYDVEYIYPAPRAYTEAYQETNNDGVIKRSGRDSISYNTITSYRNVNNVLVNYETSNEHKLNQMKIMKCYFIQVMLITNCLSTLNYLI